jgi:hypothetical protein
MNEIGNDRKNWPTRVSALVVELEAAQFRDWSVWHAVRPGADSTFCGKSIERAKRIWRVWPDVFAWDRCQRCTRSTAQTQLIPTGATGPDRMIPRTLGT